jgi:hypothetical protein
VLSLELGERRTSGLHFTRVISPPVHSHKSNISQVRAWIELIYLCEQVKTQWTTGLFGPRECQVRKHKPPHSQAHFINSVPMVYQPGCILESSPERATLALLTLQCRFLQTINEILTASRLWLDHRLA